MAGVGDGHARKDGRKTPSKGKPFKVDRRLATSASILVAIIVIANVFVIGFEVDLGFMSRPAEAWLTWDLFFSSLFLIELAIRIQLQGADFFFMGIAARIAQEQADDHGRTKVSVRLSLRSDSAGSTSSLDSIKFNPRKLNLRRCLRNCDIFCRKLKYLKYLNLFDTILVLMRLLDATLTLAERAQDDPQCVNIHVPCDICICRQSSRLFLKLLSVLRVVRVGEVVKEFRLSAFFRELWLIMGGFLDTLRTLLWVFTILLLLLWISAIVFANVVGKNNGVKGGIDYSESEWDADEYWGSCVKSGLTLFQILTFDDWSAIVWPMVWRHPVFIIPIVMFLCVCVLGVLNLISGVVVQSILSRAREAGTKKEKERARIYKKVMHSLEDLFYDADLDGSGTIDLEELDRMIRLPRVRDRMNLLGIPLQDLEQLFHLLDDDNEDEVAIDKFFRGCSRLGGPALASELNAVSVDLNRYITTAKEHTGMMDDNNEILGKILDNINRMEREIIRGDDDNKDPVLMRRRKRPYRGNSASLVRFKVENRLPDLDNQEPEVPKRRPSLVRTAHGMSSPTESDARNTSKERAGSKERAVSKESNSSGRKSSKRKKEVGFQWGVTA